MLYVGTITEERRERRGCEEEREEGVKRRERRGCEEEREEGVKRGERGGGEERRKLEHAANKYGRFAESACIYTSVT